VIDALGGRVRAIAADRPGWAAGARAADLEGNAQAALRALDAHDVTRAIFVGHSWGAAVATWLAIHHPDRVAALVLAAPAANPAALDVTDRLLAAPLVGPVVSAGALSGVGLALAVGRARARIARALELDERYLDGTSRRLIKPAVWRTFVSEQRTLLRELPGLERRLSEIAAPTTIVVGAEDRIVRLESARKLASQIGGARLDVIENAGHLLPQRHSARIAEAIFASRRQIDPEPMR
jgi:pimeloyl-ACP methyl ester carboxylesterase